MRLLNTTSMEIREFRHDEVPPYAILSHMWGEEEVTFQGMEEHRKTDRGGKGYEKVKACCSMANANGFEHVWIDTCCIDKTSSAELSEAINSMYRWYEDADICYAYLADVRQGTDVLDEFRKSKWFTRGFTLQELIAPSTVIFLDNDWRNIGDKSDLQQIISDVTGIPGNFLLGDDLGYASVAQRMSWASKRKTSRIEDVAYCLMGIFGIYMPMLYGEGERAFIRLQEEILRVTNDHSLFAWRSTEDHGGILATSPAAFKCSGNIIATSSFDNTSSPPIVTSRGIRLPLVFVKGETRGSGLAILNCTEMGGNEKRFAIHLKDVFLTEQDFIRENSSALELLDPGIENTPIDVYVRQWHSKRNRNGGKIEKYAIKFEGVREDEVTSRTVYQHSGWELHHGLMVTAAAYYPKDNIIGRLLVICNDGNSFQLILRKRGGAHITEIHNGFETDTEPTQPLITSGHQEYQRYRIVTVLDDGKRIHLTIDRRILMLHNKKHLTRVVEVNYPSIQGAWFQQAVVLDGDIEEKSLLSYAARRGYDTVVKILFDTKKPDIDFQDENGSTAVSLAAMNGHEKTVKLLVGKGANIGLKDHTGQTPSSHAEKNGHSNIVEMLSERTAHLKSIFEAYHLPWGHQRQFDEVKDGHELMASSLRGGGFISTADDDYGWAILRLSAEKGYKDIVEILLQNGVIEEYDYRQGAESLFAAAKGGHYGVVELLLEKAADFSLGHRDIIRSLVAAIDKGHYQVVELLFRKGADPNVTYWDLKAPLFRAAEMGHKEVVKLLLEKDLNLNVRSWGMKTPLFAAAEGGHEDVVKLFLEKANDFGFTGRDIKMPLFAAVDQGHEGVVKLLLKRRAGFTVLPRDIKMPFFAAVKKGNEKVVDLLLEKVTRGDLIDWDIKILLVAAAENGHTNIVRRLVEKGVDLEGADQQKRTPLFAAAEKGQEEVVKLLVEAGGNIEARDKHGKTPLQMAVKNQHQAVVTLLLEKGADPNTGGWISKVDFRLGELFHEKRHS